MKKKKAGRYPQDLSISVPISRAPKGHFSPHPPHYHHSMILKETVTHLDNTK